jgi:hypothetical protein
MNSIVQPATVADPGWNQLGHSHRYEFTAFGQNWTLNPFASNAGGFSDTVSAYGSAAKTACYGTSYGAAGGAATGTLVGMGVGAAVGGIPTAGVGALPGAGIGGAAGFVGGVIGGGINAFINAWNTKPGTSNIVVAGQSAEQGMGFGVLSGILGPLGTVPGASTGATAEIMNSPATFAPVETQGPVTVLWSPGGPTRMAAENWATANGGTTLGMTPEGQAVASVTADMPWQQARPLWANASSNLAANASGEVHVFQYGGGVFTNSIWVTDEYPALLNNPNVTGIVYHVVLPDGSVVVP